MLRICSALLRPKRVTAERAGFGSLRRAALRWCGCQKPREKGRPAMLTIIIRPGSRAGLERVYIARPGSDLRLDLGGRRSAVTWLTNHGCCPGAAAMLFDVEPGSPCEIAEPLDLPGPHAPA